MFKKSIPVILGALLFGASAEAIVIPCPTTYDLNIAKIPPFAFKIRPIDEPQLSTLTFQNESTVFRENDLTDAVCWYKDEAGKVWTLTFTTKYKCFIHAPGKEGKLESTQRCKGSPTCANINCPT